MIRTIATATLREYIALAPHERIAWHTPDDLIPLAGVVLDVAGAPVAQRLLRRAQLSRARPRRRARRRAGAEASRAFRRSSPRRRPRSRRPDATLHLEARVSSEYDFEAELAVVIGARVQGRSEDEALHVVFGYTALNDVTARDLQRAHGQWFKGKSLDETCPIGPWIVTPEEIGDPQSLELRLRLNGTRKAAQQHVEDDLFGRAPDRGALQRHDAASRAT